MFDEYLKSGLQGRFCTGDLLKDEQRGSGNRAEIQPKLCSLAQLHPPGGGGAFATWAECIWYLVSFGPRAYVRMLMSLNKTLK